MIRVRSPFFFPAAYGAFTAAIGVNLVWHAHSTGRWAIEQWLGDPDAVGRVTTTGTVMGAVGGTVALLALLGQAAIWSGWEPKALQKTVAGAVVIECEAQASGGCVTLAVPNKPPQLYHCDAAELAGLPVGTVAHVRVIGDQVANYRVLQGETADTERAAFLNPAVHQAWIRSAWAQQPGLMSLSAWLFLVGFPILASTWASDGCLGLWFREIVLSVGSRYNRRPLLVAGDDAVGYSLLHVGLSVGAVLAMSFLLARGWDESTSRGSAYRDLWN